MGQSKASFGARLPRGGRKTLRQACASAEPFAGACAIVLIATAPALAQAPAPGGSASTPNTSERASSEAFDINAFDVSGNTLLDERTLEAAVYPHMGPGRTRADVAAAKDALESAYRSKGFQSVVVEVPLQTVADGIVKLQVIEAPVGRLRVVGSKYHSLAAVEAAIPALTEGKVTDFNAAQAQIAEANRLPDRQVTPVIHAGQAPGTIDVDLSVVDQEPLHASVELNNEYSPSTSPLRVDANIRYDNLWQLGHSLSATYEAAPQDPAQATVYAGSYIAPLWNTPFSLLAFGFDSNSNVATIGGVDVLGKGFDIGLRAIYQYKTIGDATKGLGAFAQSLSYGFDFKHFVEDDNVPVTNNAGVQSIGVVNKAVNYTPLNATYTVKRQSESTTTLTIALTADLRGLGDGQEGFQTKRANSSGQFIHANVGFEHTQPLWGGFEGDLRLSGQLSDGPLPSSEELSIGGFSTVRGYLESEAVGDDGVLESIELRTPVLFKALAGKIDDFRFYTFIDDGNTWVLKPETEQQARFSLYSTGLGSRFRLLDHVTGEVLGTLPLKPGPTRQDGRAYVTFSLKAEY